MRRKFVCLYPCKKSFKDESSLRKHYQLVPACKWRWNERQRWEAEEFERASERRRAEMRNSAAENDWEVYINDADNTFQPDRRSDDGSGSAGPPDHTQESGDSNLAATDDFEEHLHGSTRHDPTTEENEDPYLDTADVIDLDEGHSGYVHAPDDVEQLGDVLDGVQLGPEGDEELDPSEVELFPRAGEIKHPELPRDPLTSRFDALYEETHGNPFYPFRGAAEFELVKWLNDMPLSKVDSFLQLDWVSHV
jgi:hypothetical protein